MAIEGLKRVYDIPMIKGQTEVIKSLNERRQRQKNDSRKSKKKQKDEEKHKVDIRI